MIPAGILAGKAYANCRKPRRGKGTHLYCGVGARVCAHLNNTVRHVPRVFGEGEGPDEGKNSQPTLIMGEIPNLLGMIRTLQAWLYIHV